MKVLEVYDFVPNPIGCIKVCPECKKERSLESFRASKICCLPCYRRKLADTFYNQSGSKVCRSCGLAKPYRSFGVYTSLCRLCEDHNRCSILRNHLAKKLIIAKHNAIKRGYEPPNFDLNYLLDKYSEYDGNCGLCRDLVEINSLRVDHCHSTGNFRGLVCQNCNLLLGHARDSVDILQKAIAYLQRTSNADTSRRIASVSQSDQVS